MVSTGAGSSLSNIIVILSKDRERHMKHRSSRLTENGGPRPERPGKPRRLVPILGLAFLSALCLGFAVFLGLRFGRNTVPRLTLATTWTYRLRNLAARTASEAEKRGLAIQLSSASHPLEEVLEMVNAHEVDLGLIPGGGSAVGLPNVRLVAALDVDPLHLLVRQELFAEVSRSLTALKGKRISLNAQGAAQTLALEILRFAKLRVPDDGGASDFVALHLSDQELVQQLGGTDQGQGGDREKVIRDLPDAVFTLSPLPSIAALKLVRVAHYRLVSLPFSEAFIADREALSNDGEAPVSVAHVIRCQIPPFLYDTDPPVPAQTCQTLGVRMLLVANRDTDPRAVAQLVELLYAPPLVSLVKPAPLDQQGQGFEHHAGFTQYLQRDRPVLTSQSLAHLGTVLGGLGAFTGGMVAFYGLLRIRQSRRFEYYFHEIRKIELIAAGVEADPNVPEGAAERHRYLEARLTDLKCRAVMDFAAGGLKGEGLMQGIVALINDTRNSLSRDVRVERTVDA
jgi:hypothetical protein